MCLFLGNICEFFNSLSPKVILSGLKARVLTDFAPKSTYFVSLEPAETYLDNPFVVWGLFLTEFNRLEGYNFPCFA